MKPAPAEPVIADSSSLLKVFDEDWDFLKERLTYFPKDVIKQTLDRTTQMAHYIMLFPMRKHLKSMFKMLRRPRLNETVATDTYFSSETSLEGYNCAQVYYGCTSGTIHVYGMRSKNEFIDTYQEHMKEVGIPQT